MLWSKAGPLTPAVAKASDDLIVYRGVSRLKALFVEHPDLLYNIA